MSKLFELARRIERKEMEPDQSKSTDEVMAEAQEELDTETVYDPQTGKLGELLGVWRRLCGDEKPRKADVAHHPDDGLWKLKVEPASGATVSGFQAMRAGVSYYRRLRYLPGGCRPMLPGGRIIESDLEVFQHDGDYDTGAGDEDCSVSTAISRGSGSWFRRTTLPPDAEPIIREDKTHPEAEKLGALSCACGPKYMARSGRCIVCGKAPTEESDKAKPKQSSKCEHEWHQQRYRRVCVACGAKEDKKCDHQNMRYTEHQEFLRCTCGHHRKANHSTIEGAVMLPDFTLVEVQYDCQYGEEFEEG